MYYCTEFKPVVPKGDGLRWYGYTYKDAENRDAHARLFQTGAKIKITSNSRCLWRRRFHLIVGMP